MNMVMEVQVMGAERGAFNDKDTGQRIEYGKVYVAQAVPQDRGVGMTVSELKALPSVVDSLRKVGKLPATVKVEASMSTFGKSQSLKLLSVVS